MAKTGRRRRKPRNEDALATEPPETAGAPAEAVTETDHPPHSELVFGIVAPVGIDYDRLEAALKSALKWYSYAINPIRLSDLLKTLPPGFLPTEIQQRPEFMRIKTSMDAGNDLRKKVQMADALARYAALRIYEHRETKDGQRTASKSTAHVLFSLKHPHEVAALRRIYGPGFFLIAAHAEEATRQAHLTTKDMTAEEAMTLIQRDQNEEDEFGQRTRDTFQLADVFIRMDREVEENVARFINLVFGSPKVFPTPEEHAMFLAHAAALRSADLSRQVGAVILNEQGDVIATGCNDVPRFGGGQYPKGGEDHRDHKRHFEGSADLIGCDSNAMVIHEILKDTAARLNVAVPAVGTPEYAHLRKGLLFDLTEFGRAVHAEMEAIACCARSGVSPRYGSLFTTTFPCHNCAKHIIAAGITCVVYVEPYPKSRAMDLHDDAIEAAPPEPFGPPSPRSNEKVHFRPFVGVGARRFVDLFSMKLSTGVAVKRKEDSGFARKWVPHDGNPRVPLWPANYIQREKLAVQKLSSQLPPPRLADGDSADAPSKESGR